MTPSRILLLLAPGALMSITVIGLNGIERWTAEFGSTADAHNAGPVRDRPAYAARGGDRRCLPIRSEGALSIRSAGAGVLIGAATIVAIAAVRETMRPVELPALCRRARLVFNYLDPATAVGASIVGLAGVFALRWRCAAMPRLPPPCRAASMQALVHGDAEWMVLKETKRLFPKPASSSAKPIGRQGHCRRARFRADDTLTWGVGTIAAPVL